MVTILVRRPIIKPQKIYLSIGKVVKFKKFQLRKLYLSYEILVYFTRKLKDTENWYKFQRKYMQNFTLMKIPEF